MLTDVELLYSEARYTSCFLLVMCFVDALASGSGKATRGKFTALLEREFKPLILALTDIGVTAPAARVYDAYRNGLAHKLAPKGGFALCRDSEVGGAYAATIPHPLGRGNLIGVNVDRLVAEFGSYLRRRSAAV